MDLLRVICWAAGGHEMTELPFRAEELKRDELPKIIVPENDLAKMQLGRAIGIQMISIKSQLAVCDNQKHNGRTEQHE